jgi:UDP-glucose:(heptosyl)LPS alpha-1,3-glucosyltransferase
VERHCVTKSSTRKVIAVSHQVKADIEKHYGVDPQKVVVIPHGVDGEAFHPRNRSTSRTRVRRQLGLSDTDFVALFVGGDYRLKGLVPLLRAAKRVPKARILAAGVHQSSAIEQTIHLNDLVGRVALLGSTTDMPSLYAAADCFVLPTRYDTFSLATLEAMASGLPVIVSRAAGVSELLTSGKDCLLLDDPDDVGVLTEQLEKLVADETLRASLGSSARVTAEKCSWDETAARTASVYRAALRTE